jgi:hypothetical protein
MSRWTTAVVAGTMNAVRKLAPTACQEGAERSPGEASCDRGCQSFEFGPVFRLVRHASHHRGHQTT